MSGYGRGSAIPRSRLVGLVAATMLTLTGCAQTMAESRVRSTLIDAGLSERNADCMATRMVERLTIDQLRKLEGLAARDGEPDRPANIAQFIERVRRVGDAEVLAVSASAAGLCATGLG